MSFSGDLLTATTPARLLCLQGTWILELVRFVPVDRNVFHPKTQRLEGGDAIMQHLKRGEHNGLATAAQQLMRGLRTDEEHAFDAADGDWVPGLADRRDSLTPGRRSSDGHVPSNELLELRAELLVLRASHDRLRERVLKLESQLHSGAHLGVSAPGSLGLPRVQQVQFSEASTPPADAPSLAPPVPSVAPAVAASPGMAAPSVRGPARFKFPPVSAVNTCLRGLIGDRVSVREKKPPKLDLDDGNLYWFSSLIDDDGVEAGVLISDLEATTHLGSMLMMLSEQAIKDQLSAREPSQDAIDAMSEVANNLSAALNQLPDAIRLRTKPLQAVTPGSLEWTRTCQHRMQLEAQGDMGQLFLFSR